MNQLKYKCFQYIFCFPAIFLVQLFPLYAQEIVMEDKIYDDKIKTVQLYLYDGTGKDVLNSAVTELNSRQPLILEFDDLREDAKLYSAKIFHCNADWKQSQLNNMEFLYDFNEFFIEDYEYSFDTRVYYVHYRFQVPRVKLPGNYILAVFPENEEDNVVFTQRFMVFRQGIGIGAEVQNSSGVKERDFNQEVTFTLNYGGLDVVDPMQDVKVVVRQNQRWDNIITDLKPTFMRIDQKQLEYRHFNLENNFRGGNEYRFFDLRSVNFGGQNVGDINIQEYSIDAFLVKDQIRGADVYGQYEDLNGQYIIDTKDGGNPTLEAEYIEVHFFLDAAEPYKQPVYVFGELTNWNLIPEAILRYDRELKGYTGTLLLKQGWYNYEYYLANDEKTFGVEGSHFETENDYEIFVYYRPPTAVADMLVGYQQINYHPMLR
ncbi:MAG: DUF5103 domain-containing protein [Cyclobacteriaceae bacterium]